jgi:hypothetical protein
MVPYAASGCSDLAISELSFWIQLTQAAVFGYVKSFEAFVCQSRADVQSLNP